jgi:uncharacterized protein YggE
MVDFKSERKVAMKTTAGMIVSLLLLTSLAVSQQSETRDSRQRTVSVRGFGTVTTSPDQIRLSVQVNTRAASATEAMSQASAKTRQILDILKNLGVEAKDIQTTRVTVSAILDYQRQIQPPPIIGYSGTNDFNVVFKGKLMERVGEFMDKAVSAGATSFGGLMYENSRQRELERDALKKASADAQARAGVLAKELGAALGNVLSISESVSRPLPYQREFGAAVAAADAAAPVMTGELTIIANVDVVFELK